MTRAQMEEFFDRLGGPEGCDFRRDASGAASWQCAGGNDKTLATRILSRMGVPVAEAEDFLARCHAHGGHCDCELIWNAMDAMVPEEEE